MVSKNGLASCCCVVVTTVALLSSPNCMWLSFRNSFALQCFHERVLNYTSAYCLLDVIKLDESSRVYLPQKIKYGYTLKVAILKMELHLLHKLLTAQIIKAG